jgi:hypothetical protein
MWKNVYTYVHFESETLTAGSTCNAMCVLLDVLIWRRKYLHDGLVGLKQIQMYCVFLQQLYTMGIIHTRRI